jgi:hypothetical protein
MRYIALGLGIAAGLLVGALFGIPASAQQAPPAQPVSPALPVVPVAPAALPLPPHRWTAEQVREAFELADGDGNGELTRAEVQRVAVMPRTFEDMDQNKDGVVTRAEYEAAFAR